MHDLLLTPIVFLIAAVLLVPLAQRLGLGSVLGYLIGGCIIGPWGLGLIQDVEAISHVAEIGVVLMLFLIGLELQPQKLLEMRKTVFGGGSLQITVCSIALSVALYLDGMPAMPSLIAAVALALSSTAIAVQSMRENNLETTAAGRSAFAILLFQDMAAIPLLVVIPLLGVADSAGAHFNWLGALGAILAVLVVGRYAIRPALRLMAKTGLREIFTAFALLLVLGIAQLMTLAKLSMGLGAFLAGVLLAGSEYRKALETDLEPFKGLLLGLFFTSVGMAMNMGLLDDEPVMIAGLTVAYLVLKMVLLALVAYAMPIPAPQRWEFAGLLAQGSEFAFVVFAVARDAQVLSPAWNEILTLVVAVSMALTPLTVFSGKWLGKRFNRAAPLKPDVIHPEGARVIIAGFGRVGQIVGRMLHASGIRFTVLDNDPDLIETVRKYGFHVFYGDATRLDLLHAAEADKAILLINAIDDMESNLRLTDLAKAYFPNLKIIARARNVTHLYELRRRGIEFIERETFESSLYMAQMALEQVGMAKEIAQLAKDRFREHNLATLDKIFPYYRDEAKTISITQVAREELAKSFEQDRIRSKD